MPMKKKKKRVTNLKILKHQTLVLEFLLYFMGQIYNKKISQKLCINVIIKKNKYNL